MNESCPNCGAGIPANAASCPNCGKGLVEGTPQQGRQTIGFSQQPVGFRTPTEQPSEASGTAQVTPPPAQVSSQTSSSETRGGLSGRTVAVASVLSFLAALGIGALLYFFVLSPGTETAGSSGDQAKGGQAGGGQAAGGQADTPTVHQKAEHQLDRLDKAVHQQVGDFMLQQVEKVPPEAVEIGAKDDRIMVYTTTSGMSVTLFMTIFRDSDMAGTEAKTDTQSFVNDGYTKQEAFWFQTSSGKKIGEGAALTRENEEVVVWNNGNLVGIIEAPKGEGVSFLKQLKY